MERIVTAIETPSRITHYVSRITYHVPREPQYLSIMSQPRLVFKEIKRHANATYLGTV